MPSNRILVCSHSDLEESEAMRFVDNKVKAVIHCGPVMSGQIPRQGPLLLLQHGILIWEVAVSYQSIFIPDAEAILFSDYLLIGEYQVPCRLYGKEDWLRDQQVASEHWENRQELFLAHTLAYAENQKNEIFKPLPELLLRTKFDGKHVVIVSNGKGYLTELEAASRLWRRLRSVLIGVGEVADHLLASGFIPDLVIAERHQISERVWTCGAEIVIHTRKMDQDIQQPRQFSSPTRYHELNGLGSTEDVALRLAYEQGGERLMTVGVQLHMHEFMASGMPEMGSSLLVRLRIGDRLVDMKSLSVLQEAAQPPRREFLSTLILCGVFIGLSFLQLHWILQRAVHTVWKLVGL
ncbi:putative cytokinetic ring protein SteA [Paenibacillus roseipurpureus]|uniref:Cytokinetic ring protein SteA n=1 Tax=Paenibacillus roseopurpureus TaxID=2918901 RepID=A0AA96LK78_9BACL|nr:putative cytokinetic ring protein SteA [Paenibacillus sp. MBLB1832]WNR42533.1 putative cytokinetic ring protein SteA [Paenibacillus sp. MBLB1832]